MNFGDPEGLAAELAKQGAQQSWNIVNNNLDEIQLGLDAAGLVPGVGIFADLPNAGISALRGNYGDAALSLGAAVPFVGLGVGSAKVAKNVSKGLGGNPFKDKTAQQIDEMLKKRGFTKSGPDPAGGTGGYVNPKSGRSYHIDPKEWGKHREPNHVDVNRLRGYKGPLDKKKFPYQGD